jgi:hypothetical protein
MMERKPLRFKKARASGGQSNCIEVAHSLRHVRDSKASGGPVLEADLLALVAAVKDGAFDR